MESSPSERFLAPKGWKTGNFTNPDTNHIIHYGYVSPDSPLAIVVCLGGLSEFSEKYYEIAHDMLDRGYAFWFMDWHYQGRSGRMPLYPQRRHSDGFDKDISDLRSLITNKISPSNNLPLIMLGHSMGANIGLRYLMEHPDYFTAAAFTAPLLGIYNFGIGLRMVACVVNMMMPLIGSRYVFNGCDWHENSRKGDGSEMFSSHPQRDALHKYWSKTEKDLQVGSPTFKWVIEALKSCAILMNSDSGSAIKIPVFIGLGGKDKIVDNNATKEFAARLPQGKIVEIKGAAHEILMESDEYRHIFLEGFDKMLEQNKII